MNLRSFYALNRVEYLKKLAAEPCTCNCHTARAADYFVVSVERIAVFIKKYECKKGKRKEDGERKRSARPNIEDGAYVSSLFRMWTYESFFADYPDSIAFLAVVAVAIFTGLGSKISTSFNSLFTVINMLVSSAIPLLGSLISVHA
ncbi:unnamed protein product [Gongylonema pulchrum]|uniref:SSD domain-containing protein n=1 Tax=Gongylonema pulchrum TaxID=637853 RepID=A0A183DEN9_9BILA|nr:unnamed protein product [Gongylonema pulchrum]